VRHYGLKIAYDPGTKVLSGRTLVLARATQNLKSFNLDLRPFLEVSEVNVNGRRARYTREGEHELVIRPKGKLRKGRPFLVSVRYEGVAEAITDPDGSIEGWIPTADGAFVVNEPQGSPGWYAVNDTPTDKATYDFAVTVPEGKTVVANGRLTGTWTRDGKTTWLWRESDPMAPYLSTATQRHLPDRLRRHPARRHADLQRRRSADPPVRGDGAEPRSRFRASRGSAGGHRVLRGPLRAVSIRGRGRHHGLGARGRIRAGEPDQGQLQPRLLGHHGGPRDLAPVVRQLGHALVVA
jgi:hypothetical protein